MMTTGMPDNWKSIVLCVNANKPTTFTSKDLKCSLNAIGLSFYSKTKVLEEIANSVMSDVLLKSEFGVRKELGVI